jgi:polyhydroxybutyrate depolymerase
MWTDATRCRPSEPVAVLELHGTADEVVPYAGRSVAPPMEIPAKSAHATVADWVTFDHCAAVADASAAPLDLVADEQPDIGAETTIEKWGGCRGVELWSVRGAEHSPDYRRPQLARALGAWLLGHAKP